MDTRQQTEPDKIKTTYFGVTSPLCTSLTGDIRAVGLLIGIELVTDKETKSANKKLVQKFIVASWRQALMVCCSWDFQCINLMPPLNISSAKIEEGARRMEAALQLIA